MADEIHIVEGDIPALCSALSSIADSLNDYRADDPLNYAANGISSSDAASYCQTHAGLFDRRWKDTVRDLMSCVEDLAATDQSIEANEFQISTALSHASDGVRSSGLGYQLTDQHQLPMGSVNREAR